MAREMHLELNVVENVHDATMFVTSKSYFRRKPQPVRDAENARLPIYVLRSNTPPQMKQLLTTLAPPETPDKPGHFKEALDEAEEAVEQVIEGEDSMELNPQSSYIRRLQHLIAQRSDLGSRSYGRDPNRRVRIFKEQV